MSIQRAKSLKVLLMGDSCVDIYHYGECNRLSPEAPVPVFREINTEKRPGMALNVFLNLRAFDLDVEYITDRDGIEKHRYIDDKSKQHMLRVDRNENLSTKPYNFDKKDLADVDLIVISDYNKGFLPPDACTDISSFCGQNNIPLFVDSKKKDLSCFEGAILKINESEYEKISRFPADYELIVTMGDVGCVYKNKIYRAKKVEVFDVCGAGDVFMASLIFKYLKYGDLEKAFDFANKCASYSVTKFGTYVLTREDINDLCV